MELDSYRGSSVDAASTILSSCEIQGRPRVFFFLCGSGCCPARSRLIGPQEGVSSLAPPGALAALAVLSPRTLIFLSTARRFR